MAEEVDIDQEVYDQLIAEGKSERIARAKAKAAAMRKRKEAAEPAAEAQPAASSEAPAQERAPAAAAARTGPALAGTGVLTPEERQRRVQEALQARAGERTQVRGTERLAGQEHTHRLLAMVPPTGIQQIRGKQDDKVYTWPHLIASEFVALMACTALLTVMSVYVMAPLGELANPNLTPNPSKAPWYFMALQELLRYFHPMIAGMTLPTIFLVALAAAPYIDKNPSVKPENRKTAIVAFTFFVVFWAILTIIGSFFRGPGFNWVWPWVDGVWFTF
jgi:menaquinol-cytochrome c reductase cytochrome b/c subunit